MERWKSLNRNANRMSALNARRQIGDFFFFALSHNIWIQFHQWEDIRSFDSCENDFCSRCSTFFFLSSPIKKLEHQNCMDGSRSFNHNFNRIMNECLYFQFTTMVNFPYSYLFITFCVGLLWKCPELVCVLCNIKVQHIRKTSKTSVQKWKRCYDIRKSDNDENV